jgi:hypothetical protein
MLTQFVLTNAKPKAKPYKLTDGGGLHLLVQPSGSKLWRFRYRFNGKENMLAFGSYPEVPLLDARTKRDDARKLLARGIDPSQQKKLDKIASTTAAENTFEAIARERDVPLSRQALAILSDVWDLSTSDLVLPSIRSHKKTISENAMNSALRRMGYTKEEMTSHGFRSSASTILNERGYNSDWIEAALGHQDENEVRRTYNRALFGSCTRPRSKAPFPSAVARQEGRTL